MRTSEAIVATSILSAAQNGGIVEIPAISDPTLALNTRLAVKSMGFAPLDFWPSTRRGCGVKSAVAGAERPAVLLCGGSADELAPEHAQRFHTDAARHGVQAIVYLTR